MIYRISQLIRRYKTDDRKDKRAKKENTKTTAFSHRFTCTDKWIAVCIVPRLQARQPEYSGLILGRGGELSFQHRVQVGSGAHPASYGYLGPLSAAVKWPVRDANHSPPSSLISTEGGVLLFSTVSRLVLPSTQCVFVDILLKVKQLCAKTHSYATAHRHAKITKLSVRYKVLTTLKLFTLQVNDLRISGSTYPKI
jgi:hypothetical protein